MISETSLYLLGVTMLASLLHLLFECLAFQSDISFWRDNKSLAGLSTRALVTGLVSQMIVFLFLVDANASLLVTIPTAFGLLVQMWKVRHVLFMYGIQICRLVFSCGQSTYSCLLMIHNFICCCPPTNFGI